MNLTENAISGNGSHSPLAIAELGLNGELPLLANGHVEKTLVPSLDDLSLANGEAQRLATVVAGVELRAILGESAAVVNINGVSTLGLALAASLLGDLNVEAYY